MDTNFHTTHSDFIDPLGNRVLVVTCAHQDRTVAINVDPRAALILCNCGIRL